MHNKRRQNTMGGGNGQHRHHNNNNRPRRFNNNRPQGEGGNDAASVSRTRRSATQNREKYQMMARDALAGGDRVLHEYYMQHADHYHRVLLALPPEEAPRPQYLRGHEPNEQQQGDAQTSHENRGDNNGNGSGNAHHDHGGDHHGGNTHQVHPAHGQHLPSFITQPQSPEEPGE